jgi:subtilisin-like proprotein convertase family protein
LLALTTATNGTFAIPLSLPTGTTSAPVAFSDSVVRPIPDGGSTNVALAVSGITAPIAKVTVSLYLTNQQDQEYNAFLKSPDGTLVELTTGNGGTGNQYGTSCASRTIFDDDVATSITNGAAPFAGAFRPEGKLSDFRAKSGTNVNGTWTLQLTDTNFDGFTGSLRCWTLNLFPATCAAGSGACELCPDVSLSGALGANSLQQTNRLNQFGAASICGVSKACPGTDTSGVVAYDAYTFLNGQSNSCITVKLDAATGDIMSGAYTNGYSPANVCSNYLADSSFSTAYGASNPGSYSFNAASNATFVVVVTEVSAGSGGPYTLTVTGGDCRPVLHIAPPAAAKVALDWTTAAAGYLLETTNNLPANAPAGAWQTVTNLPVVLSSRFRVTNNVTGSNQFFRLHKP